MHLIDSNRLPSSKEIAEMSQKDYIVASFNYYEANTVIEAVKLFIDRISECVEHIKHSKNPLKDSRTSINLLINEVKKEFPRRPYLGHSPLCRPQKTFVALNECPFYPISKLAEQVMTEHNELYHNKDAFILRGKNGLACWDRKLTELRTRYNELCP